MTAHIDTVTPTWSWEAEAADGVVRGLGAADCKGSVIAFSLGLVLALERGVDLPEMPVALGVCVDEELLGRGSIVMAEAQRPRFVIAGEPSLLDVGVAEAGFVDAICEVRGVSAHGSFPERGDNAIEKAARLLLAVHDEPFTRVEHPLLGRNHPGTLWIEGEASCTSCPTGHGCESRSGWCRADRRPPRSRRGCASSRLNTTLTWSSWRRA